MAEIFSYILFHKFPTQSLLLILLRKWLPSTDYNEITFTVVTEEKSKKSLQIPQKQFSLSLISSACRGHCSILSLSKTHTHTHTRWGSYGRVIGPMQRPLTFTTHKIQMPPSVFEATIPASERPQSYALDSEATEVGRRNRILFITVWHNVNAPDSRNI